MNFYNSNDYFENNDMERQGMFFPWWFWWVLPGPVFPPRPPMHGPRPPMPGPRPPMPGPRPPTMPGPRPPMPGPRPPRPRSYDENM